MAIRRTALEHIGYFDEDRFPVGYGEEDDLCIRAANAGYACGIATNAYVFHSKSASFTKERRTILSAEGRKMLNATYGPDRLSGMSSYMLHHRALRQLRRKFRVLQKEEAKKRRKQSMERRAVDLAFPPAVPGHYDSQPEVRS